jgi:hypothetical protein
MMTESPRPLFQELRSLAVSVGVRFEPNVIGLPLTALMTPGVFAAIRMVVGGRHSPASAGIIRFGCRPHGHGLVQQFRCSASGRKNGKGGGYFSEYTGTPLEDGTLLAYQWLAIWHWHCRSDDPPSLRETGVRLGLPFSTVRYWLRERMSPYKVCLCNRARCVNQIAQVISHRHPR